MVRSRRSRRRTNSNDVTGLDLRNLLRRQHHNASRGSTNNFVGVSGPSDRMRVHNTKSAVAGCSRLEAFGDLAICRVDLELQIRALFDSKSRLLLDCPRDLLARDRNQAQGDLLTLLNIGQLALRLHQSW